MVKKSSTSASSWVSSILDNHSAHTSKETQEYLNTIPGRFEFVFTPKHGSWLNMIEGFFSKMTKQMLGGIRVETKKAPKPISRKRKSTQN